jgi:ankyrin repeat protein
MAHKAREGARRQLPMEQDMDWCISSGGCGETIPFDVFGIVENPTARHPNFKNYWGWTPLHVAAQRGDNTAIRLLLDHGADVEAQASGVCDCAAPELTGTDDLSESVQPNKNRSIWTPLHVAMCSGHEEAMKLLLNKSASAKIGAFLHLPNAAHQKSRLDNTSFQYAAWLGSVSMCKILLAQPAHAPYLLWTNRWEQSPLHYAAAGGHIRTVGKFLVQQGAKLSGWTDPGPRDLPPVAEWRLVNDPLRLLCMQGMYSDARWLVQYAERLEEDDALTPNPAYVYSRSLAALSFLRPAAEYNQLSLRERQDRLLSLSPHDLTYHVRDTITTREIQASRRQRLSLAKKLLDLGASLNQAHVATDNDMPVLSPSPARLKRLRTPLQLAAATGFTEMVKLLISRGADCGKVYPLDDSQTLPIVLAAKQALSPTGNHQTVEAFLKAGVPLVSQNRLILHHLHTFKPTPQSKDCPIYKQWLNLVELFLKHGVADQASAEQWEAVFEEACSTLGNVPYCKLLNKFRSTKNLQKPALVNMMCNATRACWHHARTAGVVQDLEMIRWVFDQCLDARRRLRFESDVLDTLLQEAYSLNMFKVVQLMRELLAELKQAGN